MKTSKVFGAIALSAALVMGTVPAFAALPTVDEQKDITNVKSFTQTGSSDLVYQGNGNTDIKASTYVPQLNVTVPVRMEVALPAVNGDIVFPTTDAYRIYNNSTDQEAYIQKVKAVGKGSFDLAVGAPGGGSTRHNLELAVDTHDLTNGDHTATLDYEIPSNNSYGIGVSGKVNWSTTPTELSGKTFEIAQLQYTIGNVKSTVSVTPVSES